MCSNVDVCSHLLMVLPGIGEAMPFKTIEECNESIRNISKKLLIDNDSSLKIHFESIKWHENLNDHKQIFENSCPNNIVKVRKFFHHVFSDVLFYSNAFFQKQILDCLIEKLNETFEKFPREISKNMSVSLIGHSLGSMFIFNILMNENYYKKLKFNVNVFFSLGSPALMFFVSENKMKDVIKIKCSKFYNIFDELDPFAYRLEPYFLEGYGEEPVLITDTSHKKEITPQNFYDFQNICTEKKKNFRDKRIDIMIKRNTYSCLNYINCFSAHSVYWHSIDMVKFFIEKLDDIYK